MTSDPLREYAAWLSESGFGPASLVGQDERDTSIWIEKQETIRDVAKRIERRRAQLDDGISKLITDLTADSDTLLQTVQHSATSAAVYAATLNVIQRLHDTLTAQGLE